LAEGEEDTVLLEFRDDGPGYPEEALQLERHDVGLDLVQNMVRKSLRGELSLRNDHGAVAVIQFEAKT
jgi:two-component sensor histidine kinase